MPTLLSSLPPSKPPRSGESTRSRILEAFEAHDEDESEGEAMERGAMDLEPVGSGKAVLVRPGRTYEGRQGLTYGEGIFAGNAGSSRLCLHTLRIPPGGRASAHLHAHHETAIYLVAGRATVLHGPGLEQ